MRNSNVKIHYLITLDPTFSFILLQLLYIRCPNDEVIYEEQSYPKYWYYMELKQKNQPNK